MAGAAITALNAGRGGRRLAAGQPAQRRAMEQAMARRAGPRRGSALIDGERSNVKRTGKALLREAARASAARRARPERRFRGRARFQPLKRQRGRSCPRAASTCTTTEHQDRGWKSCGAALELFFGRVGHRRDGFRDAQGISTAAPQPIEN